MKATQLHRRVDFRRIFVAASVSILVLSYTLLWVRMIVTPLQYTGTDYVAFYAAGRIAQHEGPGQVYDVALQQKYEEQLIGEQISWELVRIYLNPPFVVPLVQATLLDRFVPSLVLWDGLMLAFLIAGTLLLAPLLRGRFSRGEAWVLLAGMLLFFPAYKSIVIGQDSTILYFGACALLAGVLLDKDWLGGLGLAVMTVRPHLALPLALAFLFSRRRGLWWWFVAGALGLAGLSLAYAGVAGITGFLHMLVFSGSGANLTTGESSMVNLNGLLIRLLPGVPLAVIHWVGWGAYFAGMAGLCVYFARQPRLGERQISLAVMVCLFTAPHLHLHDFILLMLPVVCFLRLARDRQLPSGQLVLVPLGLSLILLFSFFNKFLENNVPVLVWLAVLALVWFPEKIFSRRKDPGEGLPAENPGL